MPRTSAPARLCSILPCLVLLLVTQALQLATALPVGPCPRCGGGTLPPIDPIVDPRVAGQLIAVNCPNAGFYVTVNGGRINPGSATVTQQRTSIMAYSKTYPETTTGPFNIIPFAPCTGGTWSPASRTATGPVATGQNFVYTRGSPISLSLIASVLTSKLSGLKLRLNNYNTARQGGSYLQLGTTRVPFTIPKAVVDLDLCGICPDLGDGIFYINNMALSSARVTAAGDELVFAFTFKDSNPEIKGFHNSLGDSGMPDFQINGKAGNPGAVVTVNARIVASGATGISLAPYGAQLIADVSSTGGCSPFGIDICNALLGTSGKVRSAVTNGVNGVLGSSKVKGMIADIIKKYLIQLGYGNLQSWGLYGGVLYVVK